MSLPVNAWFSHRIAFLGIALFSLVMASELQADEGEVSESVAGSDPLQLFEERIMPIFHSPEPSSCVQCHLSSVDIKNYILPSHTDTFVALREDGLIDVDEPGKSKILTLIDMGEQDADKTAARIHQKTRQAEYEAFSAWIHACCADKELVSLKPRDGLEAIGPATPLEVVRHARKSRIAESFTRNIWSQRMRCFPCHTPHEIDPNNPKHKGPAERHAEFVATYGRRMNLFEATPEATMARWITSSRRHKSGTYPLIHLNEPAKSLVILKPTSKLPPRKDGAFEKPSSSDPVSHMGGLKMHPHDQSYKSFVAWIEDYAAIVDGRYVNVEDLPADNWIPTQRVLRIKEVPKSWGDATVVQLFVHAKDSSSGTWSEQPVAFTQGLITPRRMVNGALFLLGSDSVSRDEADDETSFPLTPGEYQVRAFVDRNGLLDNSPAIFLDAADRVGQAVIVAKWEIGFPKAETFSADALSD